MCYGDLWSVMFDVTVAERSQLPGGSGVLGDFSDEVF